MRKFLIFSLSVIVLFLGTNLAFSQQTGSFTMTFDNSGTTNNIYFYVPADYDSTKTYPFLYGWHGSQMPGSAMRDLLSAIIATNKKAIVCCPDINNITNDGTKINALINASLNHVLTTYKINQNQTVITGFSMGGGLAYQIGLQNPNLFKGIIGFSPAIGSAQFSAAMWSNIKNIRMAAIDGTKDFNFTIVDSLMKEIKSKGGNLQYLVKQNVEHADSIYFNSMEFVKDYESCYNYVLNISASKVDENPSSNLFANIYPNPASANVNISYTISENSNVSVSIENLAGETVANLIENQFQNADTYNLNYDASKLNSGVYFLKITKGNYVETKKLIISK